MQRYLSAPPIFLKVLLKCGCACASMCVDVYEQTNVSVDVWMRMSKQMYVCVRAQKCRSILPNNLLTVAAVAASVAAVAASNVGLYSHTNCNSCSCCGLSCSCCGL